MDAEKLTQVEALCREGIERARAQGLAVKPSVLWVDAKDGKFVPEYFSRRSPGSPETCLLGAVLLGRDTDLPDGWVLNYQVCRAELVPGTTNKEWQDLEDGFMASEVEPFVLSGPMEELGCKLGHECLSFLEGAS